MIINDPAVLAEVTAASDAYEQALMDNDVAALDGLFWESPATVRYGVAENLYGFEAIAAFRRGRVGGSPTRDRLRVEIVALGRDTAVVNTEFRRHGGDQTGRQSQTWIRTEAGWKVCSAHVSLLKAGADQRQTVWRRAEQPLNLREHKEDNVSSSLEARLQRLEDIEAIGRLKARYCQACDDDHNPERVAACFTPDGLWEGRNLGVHARGHEAIKAYIGGVRNSGRIRNSAHMVTNPIITVSGDEATGEWRLLMLYAGLVPGGGVQYQRIIGFYEDEFVRVDGEWRFTALRVTVEENGPYTVEDSRLG